MRLFCLLVISVFIFALNIFAKSIVKIYYFERPPYYFTDSTGKESGFLNEITKEIFKEANINTQFISMPSKRILYLLEKNIAACSPGWFFTEERNRKFKYTFPIYTSKPIIAVVNSEKWKRSVNHCSIDELFYMNLKFGLISGFRYNKKLEKILKKYPENINRYTVKVDNLIMMVAFKRIDCTFISYENAEIFIEKHGNLSKKIKIIFLDEIKTGEKRYIICSKNISDKIIKMLNSVIERLNDEK